MNEQAVSYTELRAALEGATPGPWSAGGALVGKIPADDDAYSDYEPIAFCEGGHRNAAYIAAANPATIRALLAERDALRAEVDGLKRAMREAVEAGRPV
jgi:hypothetical protein